jgi:hypothetical protein
MPVLMEQLTYSRFCKSVCPTATVVATALTTGSSSSSPGGTEAPPQKAHLGAFLGCPPGTCVELPIPYAASASPIFIPKLKR